VHPLSHHYLFGGMAIASDVALAGMRAAPAGSDGHPVRLTFHPGPAPPADDEVFLWEGRYGMRLDTLGDDWRFSSNLDGVFIVDRAVSRIDFHGDGDAPTPAAIDVLTRRVLPRLAIATGALTLHGAALSRGGGAILMFGESGAGKSTLTAALAQAGWHIASDDLTMIRPGADGALINPGATGVCVWGDTRDGLMLDPARCVEMPGYDGKWRFEPEDEPDIAPVRLRALVFLERSADVALPRLDRLPLGEAVREATRQLIALDPTAFGYTSANRLLRAMTGVPAVKLIYPSGYAALPIVTDLLATLV
jgi:hypothetical protein